MKKRNYKDWIDEFISNEELSDEAMYAVYYFLELLLMKFEMKASYKFRPYMQKQEEIHTNFYANQETTNPF